MIVVATEDRLRCYVEVEVPDLEPRLSLASSAPPQRFISTSLNHNTPESSFRLVLSGQATSYQLVSFSPFSHLLFQLLPRQTPG